MPLHTYAESPKGRGGGQTFTKKGVTVRFGFGMLESGKFKLLVKNKATRDALWGIYTYRPYWLVIYIIVGLSALLVSTNRAIPEPLERGTGTDGSTFEPE